MLDAARECFARAGGESVTWAQIAAKAGHSPTSVGTYFPSKQALYAEVAALTCTDVITAGARAAEHEQTLTGQLAAFLDAVVDLHTLRPTVTTFFAIALIDSYRRPDLQWADQAPHERIGELLSRAIDAAVDRGELDDDTDTTVLVDTLRVAILGACFHIAGDREAGPTNNAVIASLHELMSAAVNSVASPVLELISF
jgi:TetR/AcrR family transcriptional regulator, repressor for uid operon